MNELGVTEQVFNMVEKHARLTYGEDFELPRPQRLISMVNEAFAGVHTVTAEQGNKLTIVAVLLEDNGGEVRQGVGMARRMVHLDAFNPVCGLNIALGKCLRNVLQGRETVMDRPQLSFIHSEQSGDNSV